LLKRIFMDFIAAQRHAGPLPGPYTASGLRCGAAAAALAFEEVQASLIVEYPTGTYFQGVSEIYFNYNAAVLRLRKPPRAR
jgi:hypothetical protein